MDDHHRRMIRYSVDHLRFLEDQITELDDAIREQIQQAGWVQQWELLQTLPGVQETTANEIIQKADQWSNQSAEQLRQLLETHHAQLDTVKALRLALEQSLVEFNNALGRYGAVNGTRTSRSR